MDAQAGEPAVAPRFRSDIEGLRGIAVLLVVLYHAQIGGLGGGYIGVDVFFVLSGYLISGLLVAELERHGRISFRAFYARRIRRLLPASALVLVVTVAAGMLVYSPLEVRRIARTGSTAALYASNLFFAERSTVYLDQSITSDPFLHTWSLAVEEQFYVLWPVLIVLAALAGRRWWTSRSAVTAMMALLLAGSFASCIWLTGTKQPSAFFLSLPRFWEFAAGGLAAMVPLTWFAERGRRNVAGCAGLGLVAAAALTYDDGSPFPGHLALLPVVGTALLLAAGAGGDSPALAARLVSQKALLWFGRHSYSWYLWHWPVLILAAVVWPGLHLAGRLLAVGAALGLSVVTLRLIENPFRSSRVLTARPLLCIGGAVAVTAVSVGVAQASSARAGQLLREPAQAQAVAAARDLPDINPRGCVLPVEEVDPEASCTFGDRYSSTNVVLFGDSHAGQLFPALEAVALSRGWRLDVRVKAACPSAALPRLFHSSLGRRYSECIEWRERVMAEIAVNRPAMVVMSNSHAYVERDGGPQSFRVGATAWGQGIEATAQALELQGIHAVLVADTPRPGFDAPTCVSRLVGGRAAPSANCEFDRWRSLNPALRRVEAAAIGRVPGAELLDLNASICGGPQCPVRRGSLFIYRDNNHLTAGFSRSLAPLLMDALAPV